MVSEVVRSFLNAGTSTRDLYFYRDADQREIDLVMEVGRTIHPVEIKMTASPDKRTAQTFGLLAPIAEAGDLAMGDGAVICQIPAAMLIAPGVRGIPVGFL